MAISIKTLGPGDATLLTRVAPEVFDDPINPAALAQFLNDPRHHLTAAMDDDLLVGFVSAVHYVHPDKKYPELWINEVGVAPSHQGRGLATQLMRVMLNHARTLGCGEAWVLTDRENTPAMALYRTAGGRTAPNDSVMFSFALKRSQ